MALTVQDLIYDRSLANALNFYSGGDGIVDYAVGRTSLLVALQADSRVTYYRTIAHGKQERSFIKGVFKGVDSWIALQFEQQKKDRRADVNIFSTRRLESPFAAAIDGVAVYRALPTSSGCFDLREASQQRHSGQGVLPAANGPRKGRFGRGWLSGLLGLTVTTETGFLLLWRRDQRQKLSRDEKATIVHEIGHSIGLNHPSGDPWNPALTTRDTVMSYNRVGTSSDYTFSPVDIAAMQALWGQQIPSPSLSGGLV